jgi:acyl-CoA synthetase (AMP-forming)/AMP-acid ligase II
MVSIFLKDIHKTAPKGGEMNVTHGLRRALQINAGGVATIFGDRQRTWTETGDRVARFAGALRAMGLGAGDRVAVLMLNQDRYLELYLAVAWAGAVIVPVNIRWSPAEIEDSLRDCRPMVLVVDNAFAELGGRIARNMGTVRLVHADDGTAVRRATRDCCARFRQSRTRCARRMTLRASSIPVAPRVARKA